MSEIIHKSSRGTVEVFEENGEKRIRRTIYAKMSLYELLKNFDCIYLPKIYSVDISDGKTVVTEEFITGKNLLSANLDEKQVIHAMVQLCFSRTVRFFSNGFPHGYLCCGSDYETHAGKSFRKAAVR